MKTTIQTLKEDLSKAKSKCELSLRYEEKIIETKKATTSRIYTQKLQNIQKETERVSKLREREVDVFEKIKSYLEDETSDLRQKIDDWNVSRNQAKPLPNLLPLEKKRQREGKARIEDRFLQSGDYQEQRKDEKAG